MLIKPSRSYHVTTNSHHRFRKHKNLVSAVEVTRPEQIWAADTTYVGNRINPMYLALVTDVYWKKIVGFDLTDNLCTSGSANALDLAVRNRSYPEQVLIHHSDHGIQYCSDDYQKALLKSTIKFSLTECFDPYKNAIAERVNGSIKQEFLYRYDKRTDLKLMREIVPEAISLYNRKRPHISCGMHSPEEMHWQRKVKIKTYKSKNRFKASLEAV